MVVAANRVMKVIKSWSSSNETATASRRAMSLRLGTGIGPLGSAGMVGLRGASSLIQSMQTGTIAVGINSPGTTTISAVNTSVSVLIPGGWSAAYNTGNAIYATQPRITLTNSTTVTAATYTNGTGVNSTNAFTVMEFRSGVVKSIQYGNTSGTSGADTATITAVNTAKSYVIYLGLNSTSSNAYAQEGPQRYYARVDLTNSTTVTARYSEAAGQTMTINFAVVEFF